jgi:hypothetical protein
MIRTKNIGKKLLTLAAILILFNSCNNNNFRIDVSHITIEQDFVRFDRMLTDIDTSMLIDSALILANHYPDFWNLYTYRILNLGGVGNRAFNDKFLNYYSDYFLEDTYGNVEVVFEDFSQLEEGILEAFKHYAHYFPGEVIPDIYTYVGAYNQSVVVADSFIGLALEKYQGSSCDFYYQLSIPSFGRFKMQAEFLVTDCIRAWGQTEFLYSDSLDNLISRMIYEGKLMYFTKAMVPEKHDSVFIQYTGKQLDWCKQFEAKMWTHLVEEKILFESKHDYIVRYIYDGPFTASFDQKSPARTGVWLGWQIVNSYMAKHPDVTLRELMNDNNYHNILNLSRYNP